MIRDRRNAFTLIELLIVVAIIVILSAASLALVVAPLKDQVTTTLQMEQEAGMARLFTYLIADAHNANEVSIADEGDFPVLRIGFEGGDPVQYAVDAGGNLRRSTGDRTMLLVEGMRSFRVKRDGDVLHVELTAAKDLYRRSWEIERALDLNIGVARTGGTL